MKIFRFLETNQFSSLLSLTAAVLVAANLWLGWGDDFWPHASAQSVFVQPKNFMEFDYEKAWKEIIELENQGLPKSALEKVAVLLDAARKEEVNDQFIKGLIYQGKFMSQLEEDGLVNAIHRMQVEMNQAKFPVKNILKSMLAEMYTKYLENNQWQFQNRTTTENFQPEDIRTWTIQQLQNESSNLYWQSINEGALSNVDIEDYRILLNEGSNDENLRTTLFDFLVHRAIGHFMNERNYLSQPSYQFYIDQEKAFAPSMEFSQWNIESKDTASQQLQVLRLFQELLSFHLEKDIEHNLALLDVDLKRLQYVYQKAVIDGKNELYLAALEQLEQKYLGHVGEAEILAAKAQLLFQIGIGYQQVPMGETDDQPERKWLLKNSHDLCQSVLEKYPNTVGASDCRNLLFQILEPSLHLKMEQVNLSDHPLLARIEYRNTPKVWVKIIRFDAKRRERFEEERNKPNGFELQAQYVASLPSFRVWSLNLPDDNDYHRHSSEFKIDELPLGQYMVQISDSESFDYKKSSVGYLFTHVSNLGSWTRQSNGEGSSFIVFDRKSGAPFEGVTAEFFTRNYNSVFRKNELKKVGTSKSDEKGFVTPDLPNKNRNFTLLLRKGADTLFTDQYFYSNRYNNQNHPYQKTEFFLDRAIYRPGQTVYFKGIALSFDSDNMPGIVQNKPVTVTIRDANYQEVSSLILQTNEYGTFNGSFMAPQGGLLGSMSLVSSIGGQGKSFRVEEYKRPKFEVGFEPVTGSFRLDDTVSITGHAKAYAGNNINDAQVTWRVVRETRFPWYWRSWRNPWRGNSMEVANGVNTTDEQGNFHIDFTALPDRSISADKKPEFNYTIYADVTDITGETRSNQIVVRVGYVALNADIPIQGQVNAEELTKLEIVTKNLNGEYEAAKGKLILEQLKVPDKIFVPRYWGTTDESILSENEFKRAFPNYAWKNEDKSENWSVKRRVLESDFDTESAKEVLLPKAGLPVGHYAITLKTKDKYGVAVELKKYFSVFDLNQNELATPSIGWHYYDSKNLEPGAEAQLYFGTSQKQLFVLLEVQKDHLTIVRKWLKIKDLARETQKIAENHRGNLSYQYCFASLNRSTNRAGTISVPWSNKELTIEYGTFRDKMLPGSEEEWTIKIKGPKGEKVAAELVAGMYDASLDAFAPNAWGMSPFPMSYSRIHFSANGFKPTDLNQISRGSQPNIPGASKSRSYDRLNWFNWYFYNSYQFNIAYESETYEEVVVMSQRSGRGNNKAFANAPPADMAIDGASQGAAFDSEESKDVIMDDSAFQEGFGSNVGDEGGLDLSDVPVRTNLNETVFFFPNLMTDEEGNILIKFRMNEALTKWKFLGLAHTKDLKIGATSEEVITQKELMVVPNPPRFFRENDEIEFTAKLVNLSEQPLSPKFDLELKNAMTGKNIFSENQQIGLLPKRLIEAIPPGGSKRISWTFKVPEVTEVSLIEHTVIASAGAFSDAERGTTPVLTNRMLVTETMPLPVRGGESKVFTFKRMKEANSPTLKHESLTLEFTQNPAWNAVQALPYLMEYPHECTEQIFSRYYANSLATSVANSHPKVKAIFDRWRDYEPDALLSNLSKNQELKSALLEETPWVLAAQSEEKQKQNIALLFDLNRMGNEQATALKKLQERQQPGGGWAWFPGGRDNWYITQYLVQGMGHLQKLGVADIENDPALWRMVEKAVYYCDARMVEMYEDLERRVKEGKTTWEADHLNYLASHYLYTRSFFLENKSGQASTSGDFSTGKKLELRGKSEKVHTYYMSQAKKYWLNKGYYVEGMLSLGLHRSGENSTAKAIVRSLDERSLNHDELGMYWKYPRGYWWYQAPIETHALMIEVFSDIGENPDKVDDLKVWLLKNKQTNHWKTTKATASAVYALLSSGDNWLLDDAPLDISFPSSMDNRLNEQVKAAQLKAEAGTGYFKTRIDGEVITSAHADIKVENPNNVIAWGAMYWQYFEQLDKITTFEETPLKINKQLFRVKNSDTGEVISPLNEGDELSVGEKLKVRIELRVDRDMEYVHLKDMRASGFEPMNVLSQYKWQGGLGYYESTRDIATDFFFSRLPKGTWVFEYPLRVVYNGDFSNGITTAQCMYAPEFTSHSEGVRVVVE